MSHPSAFYVKFLLARSWGAPEDEEESHASVCKTLRLLGLPFIHEDAFDLIREKFDPPKSFKFNVRTHAETKKFMKAEKIYTLWEPESEDKRVLVDLLDGPNQLLRHTVQLLLMGDIPEEVVADKVNEKYHVTPPITKRMVATYRHYFWNVQSCSHADWEEILRPSSFKDSYLAALHCGDQQALFRAGFRPKIDQTAALMDGYREVYFRMRALFWRGDDKFVLDQVHKFVARLMQLDELLAGRGAGAEDQLNKFRQVLLKHKNIPQTTVDDIIDEAKGGAISTRESTPDSKKGDQDG